MKAFGYVRVSTVGQVTDGVSLDAQRERITAWALANGYELEGFSVDAGVSGTKRNREGLQKALAAACESQGCLIVYSLSRLARSTRHALAIADQLSKAGADLVSISERLDTSTAVGQMVFTVLAAINQFERDVTAERTRDALQHKKAQGERVGQVPFGRQLVEDGIQLLPNEREQKTLRDMEKMRENGWSYQRIADELNRRGVLTKKDRAWTWETARNVLLKKKVA